MISKLRIIILFIVLPILSFGQLDSVLKSFTAIVNEDEIILNWIMYGGYQCNGTDILRSTDGLEFEIIGEIPGLCGDPVSDESYTFTDTSPIINSVNYYRLQLRFYGESHIISRDFFQYNENAYLILPHPVFEIGEIKFHNSSADNFILDLYSTSGQFVHTQSTNLDYFEINARELKRGIYVFVIRSESGVLIRGKIVISNI